MGVSNWFYVAAENVKKFAKATKNVIKGPAGPNESPAFRETGKSPEDASGFPTKLSK